MIEQTVVRTRTDDFSEHATLLDVAKGMMQFSSNACTDYLIDRLGLEKINDQMKQVGLTEHGELMPLTPEDVHKKTFTPVRLREGYDMGEVDQFLDEADRSLHDAIMIVRRARKNAQVVAGGGAIDMELSRWALKQF